MAMQEITVVLDDDRINTYLRQRNVRPLTHADQTWDGPWYVLLNQNRLTAAQRRRVIKKRRRHNRLVVGRLGRYFDEVPF